MGIRRSKLSFDEKFTQVPNEWARDKRLTRRARGLLVEIMSHRVGWHVTIRSLASSGREGRDAIQSALNELLEHGYVRRSQGKTAAGKFAEIEYELCDPPTVAGFSVRGSTVSGFPVSGKSATKKNISSEDHPEELFAPPEGDAVVTFDEFYFAYPRKVGRAAAQRVWQRVTRTTPSSAIMAGVLRYAADPNLPEKQFIPHPATWLNAGRWDDEPEVPRAKAPEGPPSPDDPAEAEAFRARRDAWLAAHGVTYDEYLEHVDEPGWLESIEQRATS